VRRAILSIARKNGKTALIAALVLVHLIGPEAIQNGEIYSAANDREQAAQVYKVARRSCAPIPSLSEILRCVDSTKTIACYSNGSFYRAMSSESGTKHGLNPDLRRLRRARAGKEPGALRRPRYLVWRPR
jgi:phage terminase large subunit-like protein